MRIFKNAIKIIISFSLLAYLVIDADPSRILTTMTKIVEARGLWFITIAFMLALLSIFLMACRWNILLRGYKLQVPLKSLFGFYLIGLFFNNFLPTSIGGDVVRVYKGVEASGNRTYGFSSVIIERVLGISATLFLAIISLVFISDSLLSVRIFYVSAALFIFISLFMFILIRKRPYELLLYIFEKITLFHIGEKINKLLEAIHYFKRRRRILLYVFLISILSQIAIVIMNYYIAKAFALELELSYLFMVVPVTFLLTMLPSINGMGVREFGYVRLLSIVGVSNAGAISLSFMNILIPIVISLWGAALFIIQKRKAKEGGDNAVISAQ